MALKQPVRPAYRPRHPPIKVRLSSGTLHLPKGIHRLMKSKAKKR